MKHSRKFACVLFLVLTLPVFNQVAIAESGKENAAASVQQQKKRTVTGTITDAADGTPIVGATVMLKGTSTGVTSDLDGNYSIQIRNSKDVLIVSYLGYRKREVPVEDLAVLNIKLSSDNEVLDEVVIVGSGTQKKVSVTGSISTVKGLELRTPSSSLTTSLAGRVAGLISTTNSGEPDGHTLFSDTTFVIRENS